MEASLPLQDNTDQSSTALVDNSLEGLLDFDLGILRHSHQLVGKAFLYQFVEGLSEDVGSPQLGGIALKIVKQVFDQFLALLLGADDGRNLGLDIGAWFSTSTDNVCFAILDSPFLIS